MTEEYLPYAAMMLGVLSIAYGLHAIGAGKNTMQSIELSRADKPRIFWLVTAMEIIMGFGLILIGAQMLDWI